eukprot:TRINITY_DN15099_c0_g1_i1.p1 TRINITY_DN15099_c0_g1~~TRINITY_DN15099_c0_g1_i1.p1  ORF type:complete len:149 (+),score=38.31 TRINITY_DN15099_c0_g1_i1:77-523(+)
MCIRDRQRSVPRLGFVVDTAPVEGAEKAAKKRAAEQSNAKKGRTKKWKVRRRKKLGVRVGIRCETCGEFSHSVRSEGKGAVNALTKKRKSDQRNKGGTPSGSQIESQVSMGSQRKKKTRKSGGGSELKLASTPEPSKDKSLTRFIHSL